MQKNNRQNYKTILYFCSTGMPKLWHPKQITSHINCILEMYSILYDQICFHTVFMNYCVIIKCLISVHLVWIHFNHTVSHIMWIFSAIIATHKVHAELKLEFKNKHVFCLFFTVCTAGVRGSIKLSFLLAPTCCFYCLLFLFSSCSAALTVIRFVSATAAATTFLN